VSAGPNLSMLSDYRAGLCASPRRPNRAGIRKFGDPLQA